MLVFLERGGDGGGGRLGRKCVCGDDSVDASDGNDRSFATEAQSSEWRSHDKLHTLTGLLDEEKSLDGREKSIDGKVQSSLRFHRWVCAVNRFSRISNPTFSHFYSRAGGEIFPAAM